MVVRNTSSRVVTCAAAFASPCSRSVFIPSLWAAFCTSRSGERRRMSSRIWGLMMSVSAMTSRPAYPDLKHARQPTPRTSSSGSPFPSTRPSFSAIPFGGR